jgi:hypothetical protein
LARHLFLLSPVDLKAPEWELSIASRQVCVKALRVGQARAIAALHFSVRSSITSTNSPLYSPWWKPALVQAEKVDRVPHGLRIIDARDIPLRFCECRTPDHGEDSEGHIACD